MNDPAVTAPIALLLGLIAPVVISLLKSRKAPAEVNQLVALGISVGAALADIAIDKHGFSGFSWPLLFAYAGATFAEAQTIYRLYFGGTALNQALENLIWGKPSPSPAGGGA